MSISLNVWGLFLLVCVLGVCLYSDGIWAYKCSAQLSECVVCAHMAEDGCELCSHMPFAAAESLIFDPLTQHPRKPSPLSVWVCLSMFVASSQTYCMFELKLDCLHWALFAFTGSIYSTVQMWHHAAFFPSYLIFMICTHWASTVIAEPAITYRFIIST